MRNKDISIVSSKMNSASKNVVYTHVKPLYESESVAFAKYIHNMENNKFFQYFMLDFREKLINTLPSDLDIIGMLNFIKIFNKEINKISTVYSEYKNSQEEDSDDDNV